MLDRQFLHRFVQFFLQLVNKRVTVCASFVGESCNQLPGNRRVFVNRLQAKERTKPMFAKVTQGGVDRDAIEPSKKRGLPSKPIYRLKSLDKGILRQV